MGNMLFEQEEFAKRGNGKEKAIVSEAREVCAVVCEWRSDEEGVCNQGRL